MNAIIFPSRIITDEELEDMTSEERSVANALLDNKLYLEKTGIDQYEIVTTPVKENGTEIRYVDIPDNAIIEDDAVNIYRRSLGYPEVGVDHINCNTYIESLNNWIVLSEITRILKHIAYRNERYTKLRKLNAPRIILNNEKNLLRKKMRDFNDTMGQLRARPNREYIALPAPISIIDLISPESRLICAIFGDEPSLVTRVPALEIVRVLALRIDEDTDSEDAFLALSTFLLKLWDMSKAATWYKKMLEKTGYDADYQAIYDGRLAELKLFVRAFVNNHDAAHHVLTESGEKALSLKDAHMSIWNNTLAI